MFKRILILLIIPSAAFCQLIPEGEIPFGAYSTHAANSDLYGNQQLEVMHDSLGINQFTCGGFYDTTAQRFAQNGIFVYPWGTYSNDVIEAQTQYAGATYFICHPESSAYYHVTFQTHTGGPYQDTLWASAVPGVMLGDLYGLYTNRYDWLVREQLQYSCYLKMGIEETGLDTNTAVAVFKVTSIFDTLGQYRFEDTIYVRDLAVGHDTLVSLREDRDSLSSHDYFTVMDNQTSDKSKELRFDLINLGNATVYVDYLKINCQYGADLVENHEYDQRIKEYTGRAGYDGSILGWFIKDIQYIGNQRPFAYIDSLIAETTSTWTYPVRAASHVVPQSGNGYRVEDAGDGYRDFWRISKQKEMWSFLYPLTNRTNYSGYSSEWDAWNSHLQRGLNFYLADMCDSIRAAIASCDSCSWMFVPEYWYCDSTDADPCYGSEQRRKPTEAEMRAMTYIGLCYQPKGIMFYKYDSHPGRDFTKGIVDSIGNPRPGMYNVIKDDISPYLKAIGPVYMGLHWERAYAYHPTYFPSPPSGAFVSSITAVSDTCYNLLDEDEECHNPDEGWFHVGEFTKDGTYDKYVMLVNRACSDYFDNPAPPVTATVNFDATHFVFDVQTDHVYIIDLAVPETTYSGIMDNNIIPFTTVLRAGEGRLYKIAAAPDVDLHGTINTNLVYQGDNAIKGDITVPDSGVFRVKGPANFKIGECDLESSGNDTGAVEIICNGRLSFIGIKNDSIHFDSFIDCADTIPYILTTAYPGIWYGIYVSESAACSLSCCSIRYAKYGIECRTGSEVTISNSNISDNSDDGIHNYKGILSVENSVINNNGLSGIWGNNSDNFIYGTRLIGNAKYGINLTGPRTGSTDSTLIQYDTLSSGGILSNYAVSITNIDSIRIYKCKARGYAQGGLYLYNSDALVTNNDFSSNTTYGIFAHDYSYPTIRQCRIDTLAIGVKAYKAKPNIGTVTPDSPGNCSFLSNTQYYIYYAPPGTYDTLWAQHNWFYLMPGPGMFYSAVKNSPIIYTPTLLSAPPEPRLDPSRQPIPLVFELRQNYPNPFNPTTTVAFSLDEPNQTLITIYNLLGQRVTTLMDEYKPAGEHSVIWNGKDGHGKEVSSGIYFYLIQSGDHVQAKKMTLLR